MTTHKLDNAIALDFIFAGNSLFTVLNKSTGNRFTFKVKAAKKTEEDKNDIHFVRVLTSPEHYEFIGTTFDKKYSHSKKTRITAEAQSVRVFTWLVTQLINGTLPESVEIWHEGRCGKCGRVLTVPNSIEWGIGPECAKRTLSKEYIRAKKLAQLL
jgi:hypothetical protein